MQKINDLDKIQNPYTAPQAELTTHKPEVVYVRKFNGRLAFWSAIILGGLILSIELPIVKSHRTDSPTTEDYIFRYLMITLVSSGLGIYLGFMICRLVPKQTKDSEEIVIDEPTR